MCRDFFFFLRHAYWLFIIILTFKFIIMKKLLKSKAINSVNEVDSCKITKSDVGRKNNTVIYFQIGLILCLLLAYALLETPFKQDLQVIEDIGYAEHDLTEYNMDDFVIYKEPIAKEPVEKRLEKKTVLTDTPIIIDNDSNEQSDLNTVFTETKDAPKQLQASDVNVIDIPEDVDVVFNMMGVEVVPIYPGCEKFKTNDDRRDCMSEKLAKLVQKKFNTDLASEEGLTGIQKIQIQFKIDSKGEVVNVLARAPSKTLEEEAKRVISEVPVMTPGKQRNKNVGVLYTMPILFKVQN